VQLPSQSGIRVEGWSGSGSRTWWGGRWCPRTVGASARWGSGMIGKGDRERFVPTLPDLRRRPRTFARSRPLELQSDRLWLSSRRGPRTGHYDPLSASGEQQIICFSPERVRPPCPLPPLPARLHLEAGAQGHRPCSLTGPTAVCGRRTRQAWSWPPFGSRPCAQRLTSRGTSRDGTMPKSCVMGRGTDGWGNAME
jgi:hypothetical protein